MESRQVPGELIGEGYDTRRKESLLLFFLPFFKLCYISRGFVFLYLGLPRCGVFPPPPLSFPISVWARLMYISEVYYPGFDIKEIVGFGHPISCQLTCL